MSESIVVGLVSDEGYFPGLFVTVFSVVLNTKTTKRLEFHIIDGGIRDSSWNDMLVFIQKLNSKVVFKRYSNKIISSFSFDNLPAWFFESRLVYDRLKFPYFIESTQIIYLDCDVLFNRDIEELWEIEFEGNVLMAVQDTIARTIDWDGLKLGKPLCDLYGIPRESIYFSSGVLKINVELWKELAGTEKMLDWLEKHKHYNCLDQSAINFIFYNQIKKLPLKFNTLIGATLCDFTEPVVMHFIASKKPWMVDGSFLFDPSYFIYNEFLKRLPLKLNKKRHKLSLRAMSRFPFLAVCYFELKSIWYNLMKKFLHKRFADVFSSYWRSVCIAMRYPETLKLIDSFVSSCLNKLNEFDRSYASQIEKK